MAARKEMARRAPGQERLKADTVLEAPNYLTSVGTYEELIGALVSRRKMLGLSQLDVDEISGLPQGYTSKIEISATNPDAKNARSLGKQSLPLLLGALGVRLAVVKDGMLDAAEHQSLPGVAIPCSENLKKLFSERGKKGARRANENRSEKQRRAIARKAARARWDKAKASRQKKGRGLEAAE